MDYTHTGHFWVIFMVQCCESSVGVIRMTTSSARTLLSRIEDRKRANVSFLSSALDLTCMGTGRMCLCSQNVERKCI